MPDSCTSVPASVPQPAIHARPLAWLLGSVVGIMLFAVVAAHLPDRTKLLGLFPLFWGAVAGAGLRWWANECHLESPRWLVGLSCVLLAAGEAGIVAEAWRVHRTELQRQFESDPSTGFLRQAQKQGTMPLETAKSPEEAALHKQLQTEMERVRELRRYALSLPAFLSRRLKRLGVLPQPWPEVFWAGEIVLGSLCGVWVLHQMGSPRSSLTKSTPVP